MSLDGGQDTAIVPNTVIGINLAPDGKHILFATLDDSPEKKLRVGLATLDGSAPIVYLDPTPRTAHPARRALDSAVSKRWFMLTRASGRTTSGRIR